MPTISKFFGIVISMHWGDHLPPHFHAERAEFEALILIDSGKVWAGGLPKRDLSNVRRWAALHKEELMINWELASQYLPLNPIPPLV